MCSSSTVAFTSRKCSWSQLPSTSVSPALDAAMAPWTSGGGNGATAVRRGDQGLREAKNGPVRGDAPLRHGSAPVLSAFARSGMSGGLQLHGRSRGFLLFIFKYFCGSILPGVFIILRLYEPRTNEHTANGCGLRPVSPRACDMDPKPRSTSSSPSQVSTRLASDDFAIGTQTRGMCRALAAFVSALRLAVVALGLHMSSCPDAGERWEATLEGDTSRSCIDTPGMKQEWWRLKGVHCASPPQPQWRWQLAAKGGKGCRLRPCIH